MLGNYDDKSKEQQYTMTAHGLREILPLVSPSSWSGNWCKESSESMKLGTKRSQSKNLHGVHKLTSEIESRH